MSDRTKGTNPPREPGYDLKCHACGDHLPLLHPHIMVERYDDSGNIICEDCFASQQADTMQRSLEDR